MAGDVACENPASAPGCLAANTASLIQGLNPGLVLAPGDLVYDSGTFARFQSGYDPTWGQFKAKTFPAPGNHEYNDPGAAGYKQYWGAQALSNGHTWRSKTRGSWKLIALDSNCTQVGGCSASSPQGQWLASQLATAPRCTIIFWHHPRVSSGPHGDNTSMSQLWQMAVNKKVEMVLTGHDHDYERFAPLGGNALPASRGTREFVVGTGGKTFYGFSVPKTGSQKRISDTAGVLQLNLYRYGYAWSFRDTANHSLDQGSSSCH